ncbi:hypothetical protein [Streptomyces sp. NBC_00728]|uniref:hypothetical protein n=1 Tax=Streptomyces sp. NBC_00728 TaxID=2903676 RepID=UPI00386FD051
MASSTSGGWCAYSKRKTSRIRHLLDRLRLLGGRRPQSTGLFAPGCRQLSRSRLFTVDCALLVPVRRSFGAVPFYRATSVAVFPEERASVTASRLDSPSPAG